MERLGQLTWVKLATGFPRHPKGLAAGPAARHLYLMGLCWAGQYNTDGLVPHYALAALASDAGLVLEDAAVAADRLVEAVLWERVPDGWSIHDWTDWQTPAEERNRKALLAKERKERWKARRALELAERRGLERVPNAPGTQGERCIEGQKDRRTEIESSSSSSGPEEEEEDEGLRRLRAAAELAAQRRLDVRDRDPALKPVLDRQKWVRSTATRIMSADGERLAVLGRDPSLTAIEIADRLQPDTAGLGIVSAARARQAQRKKQPVGGER